LGTYKNGVVEFLAPVDLKDSTKVLVLPKQDDEEMKDKTQLKPQPVENLLKLEGILSLGGDAVEDSEKCYE
jgi:predicted DNA-binding antitoxin AbrB/MazE fold protein